jgi:predicted ATPase
VPGRSSKRHHNLPAHRVNLIGREQDLAVARQALLGAEGRLLTLIGTGGCGKTRLALELASELVSEFRDGVWLVELAPLADARLVPQAMASALGVRDQPGESLLATLVRLLSRRELLLVLDNCEHVIEVCAQVAEDVLDQCPRLRVLATSREALRIAGEKTWRVPSLAVPDQRARVDDQLRSPAVQLFVERAQATVADFSIAPPAITAIGRICRRLDGLPLAIELAAARVRTLGVAQILERLDDCIRLLVGGGRTAPSRQQTLLATLDWSTGCSATLSGPCSVAWQYSRRALALRQPRPSALTARFRPATCSTSSRDSSTSRWWSWWSATSTPVIASWNRSDSTPTSCW